MEKKKKLSGKVLLIVAVAVVFVIAGIKVPNFLTVSNIFNVVRQSSIVSLVAYGMTMVIIVKGIDLSVGGIIASCAMISGLMMQREIPVAVSIMVG